MTLATYIDPSAYREQRVLQKMRLMEAEIEAYAAAERKRLAERRVKHPRRSISLNVVCLTDGEYYANAKDAAASYGVSRSTVISCIRDHHATFAGLEFCWARESHRFRQHVGRIERLSDGATWPTLSALIRDVLGHDVTPQKMHSEHTALERALMFGKMYRGIEYRRICGKGAHV